MYNCRILADSLNPKGSRLTTFEVTFPRIVLAEFNTHRMFSRNAASSRAIPVNKMIQRVMEDPFIPIYWGKNEKGMAASEEMSDKEKRVAEKVWLKARDSAVASVERLIGNLPVFAETGVQAPQDYKDHPELYNTNSESLEIIQLDTHKQISNRLLEPWMWLTDIVSATDYNNYFNLRCHPAAQPEIRKIAEMMLEDYLFSTPDELNEGDWHLPLRFSEDSDLYTEELIKVCVGRCARVSYLTHDGKRDPEADVVLHDRLLLNGHMSPFEHVAMAKDDLNYYGNFCGFQQYRKMLNNENRNVLNNI